MSYYKVIYGRLKSYAPLEAYIGDKVYPVVVPETRVAPYVVYNDTSIVPTDTKSGASIQDDVRVQIDCYSVDFEEVQKINEVIRERLDQFSGTINEVRVIETRFVSQQTMGFDDLENVFRVMSEYRLKIVR